MLNSGPELLGNCTAGKKEHRYRGLEVEKSRVCVCVCVCVYKRKSMCVRMEKTRKRS